jgi:D-threo-aldose 1-dehydrogenase
MLPGAGLAVSKRTKKEIKMKFRTFGKTGIEASEIILGAGNISGLYTGDDADTQRQLFHHALDGGITWIDTAFRYGNGKSETALGKLLPETDHDPTLSTKVGIEPEDLDDIPAAVERSLKDSLKRLGRSSVDLFQLHNRIGRKVDGRLLTVEHVLGPGGVVEGMRRLQDLGLTRYIGITGLGETDAIREVVDSGAFDSAQIYYNMLNPSAGQAMPQAWTGQDFGQLIGACKDAGMAVIVIRSFAAGVLATETRHGRESIITSDTDLSAEERKAAAIFESLGDTGGTRGQTALRFALSNPDISCVDVGVANLDELNQALEAVERGPLPQAALDALQALYETDFGNN